MAARDLVLLTGTPLSKPGDAYAYVKLISPFVYRNQRHFEALHVVAKDYLDHVTQWGSLEFLKENLLLNSSRVLKRDVLPWLPPVTYRPTVYDMEPEHQELYRKLAEEQVLLLEQGGKIDASTPAKLYQAVQQIIMNPEHFSGKPMRAAGYDLLDEVIEELAVGDIENGHKLIVYANYRMTLRALLEYLEPYGVVGCYSEISAKKQEQNFDRFLSDPTCRIWAAHPLSGGVGLNPQEVCSDALFLEAPIIPKDFLQAVGRLERDGQHRAMNVWIGIAEGTIQVRLHKQLLVTDALVNKVQQGWQDLRDAIYGK